MSSLKEKIQKLRVAITLEHTHPHPAFWKGWNKAIERVLTILNEEGETKMKFKSDLEMWHKFKEFAEQLKFVASAQEDQLISQCVFYHWDNDAFEEYCKCPDISRSGDFESKKECWKCPFYKEKEAKS